MVSEYVAGEMSGRQGCSESPGVLAGQRVWHVRVRGSAGTQPPLGAIRPSVLLPGAVITAIQFPPPSLVPLLVFCVLLGSAPVAPWQHRFTPPLALCS